MNFKLSYSNLQELWNYVSKNCNGSELKIEITLENKLLIHTTDKYQDPVIIIISEQMLPKLTKTTRLPND